MNIWNKVLLGLIIVVLLPLFYFSAVALKTHKHWRAAANRIEKQLPLLEQEIDTLKFGDPDKNNGECLQSVRFELYKYLANRGRVWRDCAFQGREGNVVSVSVDKPDPHGVAPHMVVYVFDELSSQQGGCFLGEFKVNAVDKKVVTLEQTMRLTPRAMERIKAAEQAKGKPLLWTLREVLPSDTHEVFAGIKEEQLRATLPASVVDEYLTDGKEGKVRALRDYYVQLKELDRQITVLLEEVESATRDEQYMQAALADAKKQQLFRQDERAALTAQLNRMKEERKASLAYEQSLQRELADLEAQMGQLVEDNRAVAADIAQMQAKMIRQVDRRTAATR